MTARMFYPDISLGHTMLQVRGYLDVWSLTNLFSNGYHLLTLVTLVRFIRCSLEIVRWWIVYQRAWPEGLSRDFDQRVWHIITFWSSFQFIYLIKQRLFLGTLPDFLSATFCSTVAPFKGFEFGYVATIDVIGSLALVVRELCGKSYSEF